MGVNAGTGKTVLEKMKSNPYGSEGTYNLLNNQYNPPQGNFLSRAWDKVKGWISPNNQQDPTIVENMKRDFQKAQSEIRPGKPNWTVNYMNFEDWMKQQYNNYVVNPQDAMK
jgi:hypothetical protein